MSRHNWSFISGLTVVLLLLLVLSGYCVMVTRTLTGDLDRLIASNYDAIRAIRHLRDSTTRLNAHYRKAESVGELPESLSIFQHERDAIRSRLTALADAPTTPAEAEKTALLAALCDDFLNTYADYLSLRAQDSERFGPLTSDIAQITGAIADASSTVIEYNEAHIFQRRDAAVKRGEQATTIALAIAGVSLVVYFYTSWRMTQGIYQPLRQLRDAILRVSRRQFDEPVPEVGGVELGQIAAAFNGMALELRAYLEETDEKAVQAARDYQAILAALPYPVYIVNDSLEVRLGNPRGQQLAAALGVPGALPAAVRRQVDEAAARGAGLVDDDMHRVIELEAPLTIAGGAMESARKPAEGGALETESREAKTPRIAYLPQTFRLLNRHGARDGWAVLLVDVTGLRRLDAAKTKALSTLGHEVKTPVTGIRMTLHLLLEEKLGPLNADQREMLEAGRDDCERLLVVLQALLELARLEGGSAAMKLEPTSPELVLAQAETMYGEAVRRSPLALTLEVDPAPPDAPVVLADPLHAGRVLGNFLGNAAKYASPGTTVRMRAAAREDGFVRFTVGNVTARPLSETEQARVFDPFYRRTGERGEGAGLGLAIAREIAAAHGGRIGVWAEDERVQFYLDLRTSARAPALGSAAAGPV